MSPDIAEMSKTERLQIMEAIWDALCHDREEVESPQWHAPILEDRRLQASSEGAEFLSLSDVKRRLQR